MNLRGMGDMEKISEGVIDIYRYIVFALTDNEINSVMKDACDYLADTISLVFDDIPEDGIERIRRCEDPHYIFEEYGIEPDVYIPDPDEVATEILLTEELRRNGINLEAEAMEESGYGLPEYSLYVDYDARSWRGRWYFSKHPTDICIGIDDRICKNIQSMIEDLERRIKDKHIVFVIWR